MASVDQKALDSQRIRMTLTTRHRQQRAIAYFMVSLQQASSELQTLLTARNACGWDSPETNEAIDHLTRCIENEFFKQFGHDMIKPPDQQQF